jgi:integrase
MLSRELMVPGPRDIETRNFARGRQSASPTFLVRADRACRFHDLRHTSVALAIAEGAHSKTIQARMGHSSITVTLDRYGHLFPELDESLASAFDARLRASRDS